MSNASFYTKYRPKSFGDIKNQDIIISFLKKSLENKKTNHFYIFSGNKGTGKTTTARIFSKAINCNAKDEKPCVGKINKT